MSEKKLTFALFGHTFHAEKSVYIEALLSMLKERGGKIVIARNFYQYLKNTLKRPFAVDGVFDTTDYEADIVLSIGGDGTFLQAASNVGERDTPILGINTGRLGFLADTTPAEMKQTFDDIFQHRYQIESRSLLQVECPEQPLRGYPFGLNEISVLKRDSSSMISIRTTVNDIYLNTYQADGLILATPTGSTAYSLSVGGPIIAPQSNTIAMTPVAPHSLNMRPIVLTDDCQIILEVESRSHNFLVSIDGRSETCRQGSRLIIRKAPFTVKLIKRLGHHFFETLHQKMMWGADGRV